MGSKTHLFQAPKGTRDFYPEEMAMRRHIESIWRAVSINHGFDEVEGPNFEHLALYTVKSGEGIVSELFSFRRAGGETDYALRPEFTPTLARMVAAKANALPMPIKWFSIPTHFRAERPQRGRLREFVQWNVDVVGDASERADAEVIAVAVDFLRSAGLSSKHVTVKISHRALIAEALAMAGVAPEQIESAMGVLDKRDRLDDAAFAEQCAAVGLDFTTYEAHINRAAAEVNGAIQTFEGGGEVEIDPDDPSPLGELRRLVAALHASDVLRWCAFDAGIVRGLAYYTGIVFEIHEASGTERAIAGGGRYDRLIELFGGPSIPAVGFAMGDVVIRLVLQDHGLLHEPAHYQPRPDVFIISNGSERADHMLDTLLSRLRREGRHVRRSYKATKNIGKLLGDAGRQRARCAVILGDELERHHVVVKDLERNDQREVSLDDLEETITHMLEAD